MGLFGPKPPLARDEMDWMLAAFQWLQREHPASETVPAPLILPDDDHFPPAVGEIQERAEQHFERVKSYMEMADWPTRLVSAGRMTMPSLENAPNSSTQSQEGILGCFQLVPEGDGYVGLIQYEEGVVERPMHLIATFSHELAHYLLAYAKHEFPGGEDLHELLTDVTAVWAGFGIFLANSARDFHAGELGWSTQHQGYLSERARVTALVINEYLSGRDPKDVAPYLKPYLRGDLDVASKWFANRDVCADVMAIDLDDYGAVPYASD